MAAWILCHPPHTVFPRIYAGKGTAGNTEFTHYLLLMGFKDGSIILQRVTSINTCKVFYLKKSVYF
jgi:hypothetical protein